MFFSVPLVGKVPRSGVRGLSSKARTSISPQRRANNICNSRTCFGIFDPTVVVVIKTKAVIPAETGAARTFGIFHARCCSCQRPFGMTRLPHKRYLPAQKYIFPRPRKVSVAYFCDFVKYVIFVKRVRIEN